MRICGVELRGNDANVAVIDVNKGKISFVKTAQTSFSLEKDEDTTEVRKFTSSLNRFFDQNKVNKIVIKKRNKKGQYAGGAVTFKIEGLLQLVDKVAVELLAPQSISATVKKHGFKLDEAADQSQETAYFAACTLGVSE